MDDEPQPIDRRQALAGLSLIGTLSLVLMATILFRIVTSSSNGEITPDAATVAQQELRAAAETAYNNSPPGQSSAADAPRLIRDFAVGAASHNELTTSPRFVAPAR